MLVAVNCGAQSMRDMTVNYPSTYWLSPAISLDQYLQSQLIADIKFEIVVSVLWKYWWREGVHWPPHLFNHSFHFHCSSQPGDRLSWPGQCQEEESWTSAHCPRAPSMQREPVAEKRETVQARAAGQSRKMRETWILKQGRCFLRCCFVQGTWRWAAVQPPQPCCCPRWHLHPLPPLVSHSHHSSSDILSIYPGRALTGGMVERSRRLCLSLLQET